MTERRTTKREAGPGMPATEEREELKPQSEPSQLPERVEPETAELATQAAVGNWGKLMDLPVEQAAPVFRALCAEFPEYGPVKLAKYFDFLGGSTIYENAEFWLDRLASDDRCVRKPDPQPLLPDTPEWERYMGQQDPQVVVAAYLCKAAKLEPLTGEVVDTPAEVGYSLITDEVLYGQAWVDVPGAQNAQEARKLALEGNYRGRRVLAGTHPLVAENLWIDRTMSPKKSYQSWSVRFSFLRPDYDALAHKTARTRSVRRCGKRAFGLTDVRVDRAKVAAQLALGRAREEQAAEEKRKQIARRAHLEDPYATEEEVKERVEAEAPEVTRPSESVDEQEAPEALVRKLYGHLTDRVGSAEAHATFKAIIADLRGLDASDPAALEPLNPHEITIEEATRAAEIIERLPLRNQEEALEIPLEEDR